jgi:hypothetical protein
MKKKGMPDTEIGKRTAATKDYDELLLGVVELLEASRFERSSTKENTDLGECRRSVRRSGTTL